MSNSHHGCRGPAKVLGFILFILLGIVPSSLQWSSGRIGQSPPSSSSRRWSTATSNDNKINVGETSTIKSYEYDGWKLTYRTIVDSNEDGGEHRNVLLIHPIGIGLASWFWDPLMARIRDKNHETDGTDLRVYAPNLIGCGISEGSDAWDPDQRGLFVPLGWAKGCEALMNQVRDDEFDSNDSPQQRDPRPWTIVAQGGLAPVGILLAARNPDRVAKLVLTSPPTWEDVTTAVPAAELERNYNLLRSPLLGKLAFYFLEKRSFVRFFSNLFLFTRDENGEACCDVETWLDRTEGELCEEARPPVQAFNAGLCQNRSFEEELKAILRKIVVVQGENDKRERSGYTQNLSNCELVVVPGTTNVVPWERPEALLDLLK